VALERRHRRADSLLNDRPLAAVVFDLDGVLIDSKQVVERVWRSWAEERGVPADAVLAFIHGRRAHEVVGRFAPQLDVAAEAQRVGRLEVDDSAGLRAIPGAFDCVSLARRGPWAIVTSGARELATTRLAVGGLPVPEVLIAAEDVANGKPDPEPYTRASWALGVPAHRCIAVEDAPAGITAAKRAGMIVLGVATTHPAGALAEADLVLGSVPDVADELSRLLAEPTVPA
jgi:sugar-phosphatase